MVAFGWLLNSKKFKINRKTEKNGLRQMIHKAFKDEKIVLKPSNLSIKQIHIPIIKQFIDDIGKVPNNKHYI